ncbi:MAG: hypothetical protein Q8N53_01110 [Longimicrobiales bacterium]|nr:hypothetical protein [Longimicrobiales bacterium]
MSAKVITTIIADDTDTQAFFVPRDRIFHATQVEINNRAGAGARVRAWDTVTDTDGGVHSSAALPVPLLDVDVPANDTVVITVDIRMMATIVLQADCAGIAAGTPVVVGISGDWEV